MANDRLKKSRLSRLSAFGGVVAGIAGDAVGVAARGRASASKGVEREFHERVARRLLASFGQMRGLPMMFGQMLSYVDDMVPEEFRPIYREALGQLRVYTNPMTWQTMSQVIEEAFGAPPGQIFDAIDESPIAAASIGQVYRATYQGQPVAVKVQYPGVAEAIESDMKNAGSFISAISAIVPKTDVSTSLADIGSRLREECDYRIEAANQAAFCEAWRGDHQIHIPAVLEARQRVLISAYRPGSDWETVVGDRSSSERSAFGQAIARFVFVSLHGHGMFNADPHPGNYAFHDGGAVTFFDFGCVQRFSPEDVLAFEAVQDAALGGTRGAPLRDLIRDVYGVHAALDEELWSIVEDYVLLGLEPMMAPQPYRYSTKYTKRLADHMMRAKLVAAKKLRQTGFWDSKRPGVVFLHRINYGVASLLARLEAEVDWLMLLDEARELRRGAGDPRTRSDDSQSSAGPRASVDPAPTTDP